MAEEATAITPLLSGAAKADSRQPPLPWTHDLPRQFHLQLLLSTLSLLLALALVLVAALALRAAGAGADGWAIASVALGGTGMLLDALGIAVLLQQGRRVRQQQRSSNGEGRGDGEEEKGICSSLLPLTSQLLFNAGALAPYRILSTVLAFTAPSSSSPSEGERAEEETTTALALEGGLTGAVALVALTQLLASVYFFQCLRTLSTVDGGCGWIGREPFNILI